MLVVPIIMGCGSRPPKQLCTQNLGGGEKKVSTIINHSGVPNALKNLTQSLLSFFLVPLPSPPLPSPPQPFFLSPRAAPFPFPLPPLPANGGLASEEGVIGSPAFSFRRRRRCCWTHP
jgi:hypothetical protein